MWLVHSFPRSTNDFKQFWACIKLLRFLKLRVNPDHEVLPNISNTITIIKIFVVATIYTFDYKINKFAFVLIIGHT